MTPQLKIVVEKHSDGYVAYPLGLARGVVVGQGDTYEEALSDVRSAIAFHVETFGAEALASADMRLQKSLQSYTHPFGVSFRHPIRISS